MAYLNGAWHVDGIRATQCYGHRDAAIRASMSESHGKGRGSGAGCYWQVLCLRCACCTESALATIRDVTSLTCPRLRESSLIGGTRYRHCPPGRSAMPLNRFCCKASIRQIRPQRYVAPQFSTTKDNAATATHPTCEGVWRLSIRFGNPASVVATHSSSTVISR